MKFDKNKIAEIISNHIVGKAKAPSAANVNDNMVKFFNSEMDKFMKKYPKFDVDLDDYSGSEDDEFIENILIPTAEMGGINLFETEMVDESINLEDRKSISKLFKGHPVTFKQGEADGKDYNAYLTAYTTNMDDNTKESIMRDVRKVKINGVNPNNVHIAPNNGGGVTLTIKYFDDVYEASKVAAMLKEETDKFVIPDNKIDDIYGHVQRHHPDLMGEFENIIAKYIDMEQSTPERIVLLPAQAMNASKDVRDFLTNNAMTLDDDHNVIMESRNEIITDKSKVKKMLDDGDKAEVWISKHEYVSNYDDQYNLHKGGFIVQKSDDFDTVWGRSSLGKGTTAVNEEDYFKIWKENGTLDDIVKRITRDSKGKSGDMLNKIASDIIDDENFHGDKPEIIKSREYIMDKVGATYVNESVYEGEEITDEATQQIIGDILTIVDGSTTRGDIENIIYNQFGFATNPEKVDQIVSELKDKGLEIYDTNLGDANESMSDVLPFKLGYLEDVLKGGILTDSERNKLEDVYNLAKNIKVVKDVAKVVNKLQQIGIKDKKTKSKLQMAALGIEDLEHVEENLTIKSLLPFKLSYLESVLDDSGTTDAERKELQVIYDMAKKIKKVEDIHNVVDKMSKIKLKDPVANAGFQIAKMHMEDFTNVNEAVSGDAQLAGEIADDLLPKLVDRRKKGEKITVKELEDLISKGGGNLAMTDLVMSELVSKGFDFDTSENVNENNDNPYMFPSGLELVDGNSYSMMIDGDAVEAIFMGHDADVQDDKPYLFSIGDKISHFSADEVNNNVIHDISVTDETGEPAEDTLIESVSGLKLGGKYLTPSGLGGAFVVEYKGEDNGTYVFENVNKTSKYFGSRYTFNSASVIREIHESVNENNSEKNMVKKYGRGTPYTGWDEFHQALSYMTKKEPKEVGKGDTSYYQNEKGDNIGVWDHYEGMGLVFEASKACESNDVVDNMTYEQVLNKLSEMGCTEPQKDEVITKLVELDESDNLNGMFSVDNVVTTCKDCGIDTTSLADSYSSAAVKDVEGIPNESVLEAKTLSGEELYKAMVDVVENGYNNINGVKVDGYTASAVVQVADKLNSDNRNKFLALPIKKLVEVTWKVMK